MTITKTRHINWLFLNFLVLLKLISQTSGEPITLETQVSQCNDNEYFDTTYFQCRECPINTVPINNKLSCQCDNGFYEDNEESSIGLFIPNCIQCENGHVSTKDRSKCLPCEGQIINNQCACNLNLIPFETQDSMICIQCDPNALRGTSDIGCERCPIFQTYSQSQNQCICQPGFQLSSNICIPIADAQTVPSRDNAIRVAYDFVENRDSEQTGSLGQVVIQSETFEYLYFNASVGCSLYKYPRQCQILANLCVLQLYNELAVVCQVFQSLTSNTQLRISYSELYNDPGWKQGLPWIYYGRATTDVLNTQKLRFRVSFGYENTQIGILNKLNYVLAKFDLEGNFLGFEKLTDQLYVCETSNEEIERLMTFGTTMRKNCQFDLARLISSNPNDLPKQANLFYEIFIQDYNGDLIDVPVLITNFQNRDGGRPNAESEESEQQLTRRFFMFDTKSGISGDGTYIEGSLPQYVRYPQQIKLKIRLDTNKDEMIFTPVLEITYRERSRNVIEQGFTIARAEFTSEYAMDTSGFWNSCRTVFIILNIVFGILLLIQLIVWCQTPQLSNDASAQCKYAIVKILVTAIDLYSYLFFWFLFAMTGYWFIFFKLQERVYILLPELNTFQQNYRPYATLFGIVASFKLLTMLYKILFEQCAFDVFFIDWERPKIPYEHQGETKMGVNAWRSLLLANEFNELQTQKIISTEFTLIIFALIMEGFGLRYFSTHDSVLSTQQKNSPENYVLQFFITTLTIYIIGILQYGIRYLIKFKVALNQEQFTDLCSVLNISVLMFDNSFHGYYIHGRSPYGQAEVTSEQLRKGLEYEESGQAQQRGLCAEEPNLQTYEIFMPKRMLQDYKDHFMKDVKEEILKQNNDNQKRFNAVEVMLTNTKAIPTNLDLELVDDQKNFMNMIMQTYIEQVRTEPRKYIQNRSPLQRLLNLPANNNVNKGIPILFRDSWCQFSNLFLFGLEFDFLMLDALTISFIDLAATKNTTVDSRLLLGILIAYLIDSFLVFLRGHFGQKNVAQHTLADERFLI